MSRLTDTLPAWCLSCAGFLQGFLNSAATSGADCSDVAAASDGHLTPARQLSSAMSLEGSAEAARTSTAGCCNFGADACSGCLGPIPAEDACSGCLPLGVKRMSLGLGTTRSPHFAVAWFVLAVLVVLLLSSDELETRPGLASSNKVSGSSDRTICAEAFLWCIESVEAVEQHVSDTEDIERGVKGAEGGIEDGIEDGVKRGVGGGVKGTCTEGGLNGEGGASEGDDRRCKDADGSLKCIKGTDGTRDIACEEVVASKSKLWFPKQRTSEAWLALTSVELCIVDQRMAPIG
mmetsp:Transcript_114974/g.199333  ORF Transcript_114974/g.199333 Transcript_114974/m.199333 type:complete len:291 (-) Transcript_114974:35-907(-)